MNPRLIYLYVFALKAALVIFSGVAFSFFMIILLDIIRLHESRSVTIAWQIWAGWYMAYQFAFWMILVLMPIVVFTDFAGRKSTRLNWAAFSAKASRLMHEDLKHPARIWKVAEESRNLKL